jgi:hypothetical protein
VVQAITTERQAFVFRTLVWLVKLGDGADGSLNGALLGAFEGSIISAFNKIGELSWHICCSHRLPPA